MAAIPAAAQTYVPQSDALVQRRWWALIVIAVAQLMIALDATVVNIALPSALASGAVLEDLVTALIGDEQVAIVIQGHLERLPGVRGDVLPLGLEVKSLLRPRPGRDSGDSPER